MLYQERGGSSKEQVTQEPAVIHREMVFKVTYLVYLSHPDRLFFFTFDFQLPSRSRSCEIPMRYP